MTSVSSFPNPLALTDITLVQTVPNMLSHIQSLTWTMDETLVSSEDGVTFNSLIQELQTYNIDTA